jgi:hypothetical protein
MRIGDPRHSSAPPRHAVYPRSLPDFTAIDLFAEIVAAQSACKM